MRLWPTPSWSSWATRSRSPSWAASARPTLARRSSSSRSSMSLNASASSVASESPPATCRRRPGSSGSIRRAKLVSSRSGPSARRSNSRLMVSMSTRPPAKIASSRSAGFDADAEKTSAVIVQAAARTAALPMATRQNSAGPRERGDTAPSLTATGETESGATGTLTEACSRGSGRGHAASETASDAGGPYVHVAGRILTPLSHLCHGGYPADDVGGTPLNGG